MKPKTKEQCLCIKYCKNVMRPICEGATMKESYVAIYSDPKCMVGEYMPGTKWNGPIYYRGRKLKSGPKMLQGIWVWLELIK